VDIPSTAVPALPVAVFVVVAVVVGLAVPVLAPLSPAFLSPAFFSSSFFFSSALALALHTDGVPVHVKPSSTTHLAEQPFPPIFFPSLSFNPSSQVSGESILPLPQSLAYSASFWAAAWISTSATEESTSSWNSVSKPPVLASESASNPPSVTSLEMLIASARVLVNLDAPSADS